MAVVVGQQNLGHDPALAQEMGDQRLNLEVSQQNLGRGGTQGRQPAVCIEGQLGRAPVLADAGHTGSQRALT
jgi:hypothetical protein